MNMSSLLVMELEPVTKSIPKISGVGLGFSVAKNGNNVSL